VNLHRRLFVLGGVALAAGCRGGRHELDFVELTEPVALYEGESSGLRRTVQATVVIAAPRERAVIALDVASGRRQKLTASPTDGPIWQLSAPDRRGAVAIVTNGPGESRYAIQLLLDGQEHRILSGAGDPLWDAPVGPLALSDNGQWLLAVTQPATDARYQPLFVGHLRCWNTSTGEERMLRAEPTLALGELPGWWPSRQEVVYAAPGPLGRAATTPLAPSLQPDPQIRRLDLATGSEEVLVSGHQPVLSSDGLSMLFQRPDRRDWDWWAADGATIRPMPRLRGLRTPLALVDSRFLIYTGESSTGAPAGLTTANSPLVGPKAMLSLKVADLVTGAYETLLDGIDPRRVLAARAGALRVAS
jgi:hypothetical protein